MTGKKIITLLRPHTLIASTAPVLGGLILSYCSTKSIDIYFAVLCFLVAVLAQILSNILNDLLDFKKGADGKERKGFERILSTGKVSYQEVKGLSIIIAILTIITGAAILIPTDWFLIPIGIFVLLGAYCYTGGPFPLAYNGLGELMVFIFFGLIATLGTFYLQTGYISIESIFLASSFGFANANILVVNNYRDYEEDKKVGKNTILVLLGKNFGKALYIFNTIAATLSLGVFFHWESAILYTLLFLILISPYRRMRVSEEVDLNQVLVATSKRILFLLLIAFILIYSHYYLLGINTIQN